MDNYSNLINLKKYKKDIDESSAEELPDRQENIYNALVDLRATVDNINSLPSVALRGDSYKQIDKSSLMTVSVDGFCFGYKITAVPFSEELEKKVFIKCLECTLDDIPPEQIKPVLMAVFDAFLEQNDSIPEITQIAKDSIVLTQNFIPMYLVELKPRLVTHNGR